jgi:Cof subfamily protein (haloacid dehalogenase superfamily)
MHRNMTSTPYELVAIDVDGTLLDSGYQVAAGAREAIHSVYRRGLKPVLVTGRSTLSIERLYDELDLSPYYITSGGAYVGRFGGDVIFKALIADEDAAAIARMAREHGIGICFHQLDKQCCEVDDRTMALLHTIVGNGVERVDDLLAAPTAPAKITAFGERDELEALDREMAARDMRIATVFSGAIFLEIAREGVSKGNALTVLSEHLGIPLERIVVIGDQENDISMFRIAGLSIAMGNAPDVVKRQAQHVAPTNDESGLAWALSNIVLGEA